MKTKLPVPLEREVQRGVVQLFKACGGVVYQTSQGYRKDPGGTRMTPGLPDVLAFFPRKMRLLCFEVKRPGGTRTIAQEAFAEHCRFVPGVTYGWGGVEEAKTLMQAWGLVR